MDQSEHIPLELLQTFVRIAELDGNAATAAEQLGISQPTISKRLNSLRRLTSDPDRQPWLLLKGKRWLVTDEGVRVRGVVTDLVQRYERMEQFVAGDRHDRPTISIACGQQAASGFVKRTVERLMKQHEGCRVLLSTPRGKARIEGVAGGQFDLAIVTDAPETIQRVARMEMYVESLFEDRFVLVGNPSPEAKWAKLWNELPSDRVVTAREIVDLPFILPERDATRRRQFDEWLFRATGRVSEVVIETGGWQAIMSFALSGLGVGLVSYDAAEHFVDGLNMLPSGNEMRSVVRTLDPRNLPTGRVYLVTRKKPKRPEPDATPLAGAMIAMLRSH